MEGCWVSRTGYSGEIGYEVFCPAEGGTIVSQVVQIGDRPQMERLIGAVKVMLDGSPLSGINSTDHGTTAGSIYTSTSNTWGDGQNYISGGSTTNANGQTAAVNAPDRTAARTEHRDESRDSVPDSGARTPTTSTGWPPAATSRRWSGSRSPGPGSVRRPPTNGVRPAFWRASGTTKRSAREGGRELSTATGAPAAAGLRLSTFSYARDARSAFCFWTIQSSAIFISPATASFRESRRDITKESSWRN